MRVIKVIIFGYLALFTLGFLIVNVMNINVREMEALNLIDTLTWYRMVFYLITFAAWPNLCETIAKKRERTKLHSSIPVFQNDASEQRYYHKIKQQTAFEIDYIKSARWKVALFFVIFETFAVQKLWL